MILITGATGNIGVELAGKLSGLGQPVRAFVRSREKSQAIARPGIELVEGDFTKPETFVPALTGVDCLFLLIPSSAEVERQQCDFVDAAKRSNVRRIVKLSQLGADIRASGRFQRYHAAVENHILRSGLPYTFLRPNLFMQGLLNFRFTILSQRAFYAPAGNAQVSVVDVRDIASVAVRALTEPGHEGRAYDITGPEPITHSQMAEQLSKAVGKPIKYVDVPPAAMKQSLLGFGMSEWQADGLVEDYEHYRRGEAAAVSTVVRDVTGHEPISFSRFAKDYAERFQGKAAGVAWRR